MSEYNTKEFESMNWVRKVASQAGEIHDYSCLMADIPKDIKTKILEWNIKNIPDSELFTEDRSGKGRELQPHVTVKYGIHEQSPDPVFSLIDNKSIEFALGSVTRFTSDKNYDVLIVEVVSPNLGKLNSDISLDFDCTDTHPEYKPHLTLAYVNKDAMKELDGDKIFDGVKGNFETFLFTNPKNDMFTKIVSEANMKKINHNGFVFMQKKAIKVKIFENGSVQEFHGTKIKDQVFPCLMSAMNEYEKQGFILIGEESKPNGLGKSDSVEVYPYSKPLHENLETSNFNQVGPMDNQWAWNFIAVKGQMFAIGYNPIDAVKGLEMELSGDPKFKVNDLVSLSPKNNTCTSYVDTGDQLLEIDDEIQVTEITDHEYVFNLGSDTHFYKDKNDPESPSIKIVEVFKDISNVDDSAAFIGSNSATLPFKEVHI